VGPNGVGKTTLLTTLEFLRDAFLRGAGQALDAIGGVYGLRSWGAGQDEPVQLALSVGGLRWELGLTARGPTLADQLAERVTDQAQTLLLRDPSSRRVVYRGSARVIDEDDTRLGLRIVSEIDRPAELNDLTQAIANIRVYRNYNLWNLQTHGSRQGSDLYLHPSGQNAFTVLRNWRDRRDLRPQYDFVISGLRSAFPEVFADLDFHVAGLTATADLIEPTWNQACPVSLAPDGLLTGLLHLTAVAGARQNSLVAIDDFGNDLHPFAIRALTQSLRNWAEERNLTVCLASHSPVLLDEFKDHPESVFVMEHGRDEQPVSLAALYEPDWLARFSLGRLYEHGEFGGQRRRVSQVETE
jgi:predicted ATPase